MNWKKRYETPQVGDKLKVIKDITGINSDYPNVGDIIQIVKIKKGVDSLEYVFNSNGDYLLNGEFEKV